MTEQDGVDIRLSHDSALLVSGMLTDYFYSGAGALEARLTRVQEFALSELLAQLERHAAVSPLHMGDRFCGAVEEAARRVEAANWPDER